MTEPNRTYELAELVAAIVASSEDAIFVAGLDGMIQSWNPGAVALLGYTPEQAAGQDVSMLLRPERLEAMQAFLAQIRNGIGVRDIESSFVRRDGSLVDVRLSVAPLANGSGAFVAFVAMFRDLSERNRQEAALRASERLFRSLFSESPAGQILSSSDRKIVAVNRAFCEMTGYTEAEILQNGWDAITPPDDQVGIFAAFERLWSGELNSMQMERRYLRKDGSSLWGQVSVARVPDDSGRARYVIDQVQNVSDRKQAQQALEHQALHDALTGLPNRVLARDRLDQAILLARRQQTRVALLIIDLDHFKEVNDTFGHQAGDQLLRQVGERFMAELRETDTVARLGGDEFAIVLLAADADAAGMIAVKLLAALERPFIVEGQALDVGASIGIAVYPDHADTADTMLRRADIAMYVAKRSRRTHAVYTRDHDEPGDSRLALMAQLRQAINDGALTLHYQPIARLDDGRVERLEALVRWQRPGHGLVQPGDFIAFAEQTGLIQPLTQWVLQTALTQCAEWNRGGQPVGVAVNISMRNLLDPQLPDSVAQILRETGARPDWLTLEITESSIMAESQRTLETLQKLRALDVRLSIDDFGTGYSSLAYLHRLPVHEMKIDQSFIRGLISDETSGAIVRAAVDLGHKLKLAVVAEGIEDEATWLRARADKIDYGQGYYLSRPVPAADVTAWLNAPAGPACAAA